MIRFAALSTALHLALCAVGHAEDANRTKPSHGYETVRDCRKFEDAKARLECFDQATNDGEGGTAEKGAWTLEEERSELDRSRVLTLQLYASHASAAKSPGDVTAILVIRCAEGKTSVFVGYSALASSAQGTTVKYRIGSLPPRTETWQESQNNKAYGLWNTQQSVPVIKSMIPAPDFYVRGDARVFGGTEASFKLTGLQAAIKPIREACKW